MQKPVLKPVFIKLSGLLLLKTFDVCFWIFLAANFFQPNLVFIADSRTGFFFRTLLKTRVKTHKQPQELAFLEILQISQENTSGLQLY